MLEKALEKEKEAREKAEQEVGGAHGAYHEGCGMPSAAVSSKVCANVNKQTTRCYSRH